MVLLRETTTKAVLYAFICDLDAEAQRPIRSSRTSQTWVKLRPRAQSTAILGTNPMFKVYPEREHPSIDRGRSNQPVVTPSFLLAWQHNRP